MAIFKLIMDALRPSSGPLAKMVGSQALQNIIQLKSAQMSLPQVQAVVGESLSALQDQINSLNSLLKQTGVVRLVGQTGSVDAPTNEIAFGNSVGALSFDPLLTWNGATLSASAGAFPVFTLIRTGSDTNATRAVGTIVLFTSGTPADGLGPTLRFDINTTGLGPITANGGFLGDIGAVRAGADNTGAIRIRTTVAGTITQRAQFDANGLGVGKVPMYSVDAAGDINADGGFRVAGVPGISATIATAKLTPGGTNGSMTFVNGILTAQTPAT